MHARTSAEKRGVDFKCEEAQIIVNINIETYQDSTWLTIKNWRTADLRDRQWLHAYVTGRWLLQETKARKASTYWLEGGDSCNKQKQAHIRREVMEDVVYAVMDIFFVLQDWVLGWIILVLFAE